MSTHENEHGHHHHHAPPSEIEERVKQLETLLVEKKLVDPKSLDLLIDTYQNSVGPRYGCLLYTSPSPRDATLSRLPSSA